MKRFLCAALALLLTLSVQTLTRAEDETKIAVDLSVGESYTIDPARAGIWENNAQDVASVSDETIVGLTPGSASILMISDGGLVTRFLVTVTQGKTSSETKTENPVQPLPTDDKAPEETSSSASPDVFSVDQNLPQSIRAAIDLALNEWTENKGKTFSRLGSKNKFSRWQCGTGAGCDIGWCGAFVGYCLDNAGVPMDDYKKSIPHEDGSAYAVRAAGVGKIYTGYQNMNRLTDVPQPGYLVIYGKQGGYAYLHTGLVTAVTDNGDGTYLVQTVEGNVSNRIKRYCYLYDKNGGKKNFKACPKDLQTDTDTFQYTPHQSTWLITTFCQTWF